MRSKMSRCLAVLLAFVMMVTMMPVAAFATDEEVKTEGLVMSKTATLEEDGTYTIDLSAYSTGTTTSQSINSGVPLDIILIVDQSGSVDDYGYLDDVKSSISTFLSKIKTNAETYKVDHRVAIVGFASGNDDYNGDGSNYNYANTELFIGATQYNYDGTSGYQDESTKSTNAAASTKYGEAFQNINTTAGAANLEASRQAISSSGGTYPQYGFEMANGIFKAYKDANNYQYQTADGTYADRPRVIVFFTDGMPGSGSSFSTSAANATLAQAYVSKSTYSATVYSIGLYDSTTASATNVSTFMNAVSSNYPDAYSMSGSNVYKAPTYTEATLTAVPTSGTYYIKNNGVYQQVYYCGGLNGYAHTAGWYTAEHGLIEHGGTTVTPKTTSNTSGTPFYTVSSSTSATKAATKYYTTTSDETTLANIFQNITTDVTSSSTTVTLDATSYLQDVLADGFVLPAGVPASNVEVKTYAMTTDGTTYTQGAETSTASGLTVESVTNGIKVSGFNYSTKYVSTGHAGEILKVKITGILPTDAAVTNAIINTNADTSGIYGTDSNGEAVSFPFEQPKTILTSKSYVVDYAKPFNVAASDWKQSSVDAYVEALRQVTSGDSSALDLTNGKIDGVTYTPQTTNWNGYDSFYAFGTTTDETVLAASANDVNDKLWSKVNVIPANNVYYEDDFVASTADGVVGIEYSGTFTATATTGGNTETPNNSVHGWIDTLDDDTGYSDGSVHTMSTGATATFTFTGTGVDIYSYTDMETGIVTAALNKLGDDGAVVSTKYLMVDNLAVSGDYYQIPTLSWTGLEHGTYTVKLVVNNAKAPATNEDGSVQLDENGDIIYTDANRTTYYLDGIRVYNPIKEEDTTVQEAYGQTEINAVFAEVRDLMNADPATDSAQGNVFIDLDGDGNVADKTAYDASEYGTYGPKNEVYLAAGQSIIFKVDGTSSNTYQIGLKAPEGNGTKATFNNGTDANDQADIAHTTDLYYTIVPANGYITIQNSGDNLLSVTKIKMTGAAATSEIMLLSLTEDEAVSELSAFALRSTVAYDAAPEEEVPETPVEPEEPAEPETPEEPEEPETPDVDIEIDNPEPAPQKPAQNEALKNLVKNLFKKISGWFGR